MRDDELYCKIDNDAYLRLTDGAIAIEEQSIKVENDKGTTSSESTDHSNYSEMCSNSGIFLFVSSSNPSLIFFFVYLNKR